ncbi:4Fe-4S dicluster-binding protein, partial [Escherichia coli]
NYIKEAKYDMAVGHLLLKSFWANEAVFQMMMLSYNLFPHINLDKCVGCGRCYISCYDGGHQAMEWSEKTRTPHCNTEKCVGCLLCGHVCPVGCIDLGEVKFKKGEKEHPVTL